MVAAVTAQLMPGPPDQVSRERGSGVMANLKRLELAVGYQKRSTEPPGMVGVLQMKGRAAIGASLTQ
jgi:hypothetical protein